MLNDIEKLFVYKNCSIKQALQVIDKGSRGIVFMVDENKKLLGTITDGDIRRAILKGISIDESIENVIHYNPVIIKKGMSRGKIKDIFIKKAVRDIPIIDDYGRVIDVMGISDILIPKGKENPVVIMAGGLGTRLKDLTKEIPKPMLKVGDDPILQHTINNFKQYGYNKILLSVNYKAEIIENYFQDGFAYGVKINYIKETERLGTAGGIKLAERYINNPFFVINGDIFTNLNVENMMNFHIENNFHITVGTRPHSFQIPYGVINTLDNKITNIKEKPVMNYLINAGVYCLNFDLIELIPENQYFEITDLINSCIEKDLRVGSYEIKEYWMDIGRIEDYNKVNQDVNKFTYEEKAGDNCDK